MGSSVVVDAIVVDNVVGGLVVTVSSVVAISSVVVVVIGTSVVIDSVLWGTVAVVVLVTLIDGVFIRFSICWLLLETQVHGYRLQAKESCCGSVSRSNGIWFIPAKSEIFDLY